MSNEGFGCVELAERELRVKGIGGAVLVLVKGYTQAPNDLKICLKLAHCYLLIQNFSFSYFLYSKVSQEGSPSEKTEAIYGLAELNYQCRNLIPAEYFFQTVLNTNKDFSMASSIYLKLGIINKKQGNYQKSLDYLSACSQFKDHSPAQLNELLLQLANTLEMMKNYKQATEMYIEAAKLNKSCRNLVCLAWIFIKTKRFGKAETLLIKASKGVRNCAKEWSDIQFITAISYFNNRKIKESEKILNELMGFMPNEPVYCAFYAIFCGYCRQEQRGVEFLARALALFPDRADFLEIRTEFLGNEKSESARFDSDKLAIDITEFPFRVQQMNNAGSGFSVSPVLGGRTGFYPVESL